MKGICLTDEGFKILEGEALYQNRLERLFFTPDGGHLGNSHIGSLINDFFFEQNDSIAAAEIIDEAEYLISEYEPDLNIIEIRAEITPNENGTDVFFLSVKCEIKSTSEIIEPKFYKIREIV